MKEVAFQSSFLDLMAKNNPQRVYAPHVQLRYDIGKYSKGKDFTMPDTIPDVIEFDEEKNFHLWELKLITSSEVWNGKFFGQMMLYHLLFTTEPWNELAGRFACSGQKPDFKGDIGKVLIHLSSYGCCEIAEEDDPNANFVNRHRKLHHFRHRKVSHPRPGLGRRFRTGSALAGPAVPLVAHGLGGWLRWLSSVIDAGGTFPAVTPQASLAGIGGGTPPIPAEEEPPACGRNNPDRRFSLSR